MPVRNIGTQKMVYIYQGTRKKLLYPLYRRPFWAQTSYILIEKKWLATSAFFPHRNVEKTVFAELSKLENLL